MLKIKACSIVVFLNVGHSYLPRIFFLRQRPSYLFSFFPPDLPRIWRYDWITFSSVQSLSCVRLFVTPWSAACQASSSITNCQSLPKPMSIDSLMPSQPSHPLASPSPPALNLSQHQGLLKWVSSSHQVVGVSASTSVLPMNTQGWSPLGWTSWISLQSKGLSRVFSNTTVQKHQFFSAQLSSWSNSHIHTWLLEKP